MSLTQGPLYVGTGTFFYDPKHNPVDDTSFNYIEIGDYCQITRGVIILGHDYSYSVLGNIFNDLPRPQKKTIIGNNVFIGMNSIILMGSVIGDNVIIGSGSIVCGKIESNSVYGGNPARKICSIEEYYCKCINNFESSAKIYINGFINRYGRMPTYNEMGAYQTLFEKSDIISGKFLGVNPNKISLITDKMKKNSKFDTIEEFLNS